MKITYLLGAGASFNAIPLVKDIPGGISEFGEFIKNFELKPEFFEDDQLNINDLIKLQKRFYSDLNSLHLQINKHDTVDTYAKKLWITKKSEELCKLKAILTLFFIFREMIKPTEPRYDAFWASILNPDFPDEIKIVSWNYDNQLEKSYRVFTDFNSLEVIQNQLGVHPSTIHFSKASRIFKLNGSTSIKNKDREFYLFDDLDLDINIMNIKEQSNLIEKILNLYSELINKHNETGLLFCWENNEKARSIIKKAMESTANTDILIILGYSFPFFNREFDRNIIRNMKQLKVVYFQIPENHIEDVMQSFESVISNGNFIKKAIKKVDKFILPPEL